MNKLVASLLLSVAIAQQVVERGGVRLLRAPTGDDTVPEESQQQVAQVVEPYEPYVPETEPEESERDLQDNSNADAIPFMIPDSTGQSVNPLRPIYNGNCWKRSYSRGKGNPKESCPSGYEKIGLKCHAICPEGQGAEGGCQLHCPKGWKDEGLYCKKPKDKIRKAFDSKQKCEKAIVGKKEKFECEPGFEGWYEVCPMGTHKTDDWVCTATCPPSMLDVGISCHKGTDQEPKENFVCAPGEYEDGNRCYPPCEEGTTGHGQFCWGSCPPGLVDCGKACVQPFENCATYKAGLVTDGLAGVIDVAMTAVSGNVVGTIGKAVSEGSQIVNEIKLPDCLDF